MNRFRVADISHFSALIRKNGKKLSRTTHREKFKIGLRLPISEGNRLRKADLPRSLNLIGKCTKMSLDRARSGIFDDLRSKMASNRIGSGRPIYHAP